MGYPKRQNMPTKPIFKLSKEEIEEIKEVLDLI